MKTRAAVLYEMGMTRPYAQSKPLRIEEVELDPPGRNEVLIQIKAVGLCHSDLSVINGSRPRVLPMALGHEAAGIVAALGEGVDDLQIGDHIVCAFVPSCGHCAPCQEGRSALCETGAQANTAGTLLSGERRLHHCGQDINHHLGVSGFADYAVVDRRSLVKVDPTLPFDEVAVFGCAVMTGVGAVVNTAHIEPGTTVAIIGLGGVGLSALLGARVAGAARIIAVDIQPDKLELAKKMGATDIFDSREKDVIEHIRSATHGGVDYAFETAGAVSALDVAYRITRRGGTTVTSGLPHPTQQLSLSPVTLTAEERTLKGSYIGSCIPARDIPRYISLYNQGLLPVQQLLTDRISLEQINEGFDRLDRGEAARIVVIL
ncbi:zinc-dependent alcohol dehydrogenase family protein [Sulfoacidibacillus ferrooxidans]|uniref:Alcohol dehydrogenase D n=1 Tax=Sulfoacidibacillus ferrooxidans TaxID=2005001 RepID=A0A9X1V6Z2_9BACL|nr:zinc-dependent alcohol dehydrogenase family protein [Sulfoacidibacillus ferrooxidans]MCI0182370.1 putative alcohol dehydrogenase D [Sulfoacidibacillus ferrooxidans]